MIRIVDASIAVKWFAPDGDSGDDAAERLLRSIAARPRDYAVPELFGYEVMAVLLRRVTDASEVVHAMRRLDRLAIRRVRQDPRLVASAARLALRHRLTGYDAAYVALAEALGGRWVTLDASAHGRIAKTGLSELAT